MGFKRSLHKEVYVIKTVCDECAREYLCLGIGDDYEPICPHCGYNDDHDAEIMFSYELQDDGELVDVRKLTRKTKKSDPEFCERCENLILDCECGDEDYEEWRAENTVPASKSEATEDLCDTCGEAEADPEGLCKICGCCSLCCECGTFDDDDEEEPLPKLRKGEKRARWIV